MKTCCVGCALTAFMLSATLLLGAGADQRTHAGDNRDAAEVGVRFTPEIARAFSEQVVKNVFARRYELDPERAGDATEAMARRMMAFAHSDEAGMQDLVEYFLAEQLNAAADAQLEGKRPGLQRMSREQLKGLGERVLPFMPGVREMMSGVVQDIGPMLPFKQQMKLTADTLAMNAGIDGFEKNMKRWAAGEVDPENPWIEEPQEPQGPDHESRRLKQSREAAERWLGNATSESWKQYVEDAKKYYELDPSQSAAADSLLRDYTERLAGATADTSHMDLLRRNRLWANMLTHLGLGGTPLGEYLTSEFLVLREPISALDAEFKNKVDEIPTQAQRQAAFDRFVDVIREQEVGLAQ